MRPKVRRNALRKAHTHIDFSFCLTHFLCAQMKNALSLITEKVFSVGHGHDVDFESNEMPRCGWGEKNANVKNTNRIKYG